MVGNLKIMTPGGGGAILTPSQLIATDVALKVPVAGTDGGQLICANSSGNAGIGVSVPKTRLKV